MEVQQEISYEKNQEKIGREFKSWSIKEAGRYLAARVRQCWSR